MIEKETYENIKAFAKEMADNFTAEEIAMILWQKQCLVCAYKNQCYGNLDCVTGIFIQAKHEFAGRHDFTNNTEAESEE